MFETMVLLDRRYLDIERVYHGSGGISEIDLGMVMEFNEKIQELVKKSKGIMTPLKQMIVLNTLTEKPAARRL